MKYDTIMSAIMRKLMLNASEVPSRGEGENKAGEFAPCPQCGNVTMKPICMRDWRARCSTCGLEIMVQTAKDRYMAYIVMAGLAGLVIGVIIGLL